MMRLNRKGQSTVEYAIIVAVVISALLVMQFWMRRGVMGKLRDSTDQIGDQFNPFEASHDLDAGFVSQRSEDTQPSGQSATTFSGDTQTETGIRQEAANLNASQLFQ